MKSFTKITATACAVLACASFAFAQDGGDRPDKPRQGQKRNPAEMFKRLDKDGSGEITADEAPEFWERVSQADTDGSGGVSQAEMKVFMEARRAEREKDGDRPQRRGRRDPAEMFKQMDKDGNGEITADEAPKFWERVSQADTDGSGGVSQAELKVFAEARRAEREKNGEGRRGKGGPKGENGKGGKPAKDGEGSEG